MTIKINIVEITEARISIRIGADETIIELHDRNAAITFARVTLTPEQLSSALSRVGYTQCKTEVFSVDKINKKHRVDSHIFRIPDGVNDRNDDALHEEALKTAPEGWIPDKYYGAKGSKFNEGNRRYARVTIRKWE